MNQVEKNKPSINRSDLEREENYYYGQYIKGLEDQALEAIKQIYQPYVDFNKKIRKAPIGNYSQYKSDDAKIEAAREDLKRQGYTEENKRLGYLREDYIAAGKNMTYSVFKKMADSLFNEEVAANAVEESAKKERELYGNTGVQRQAAKTYVTPSGELITSIKKDKSGNIIPTESLRVNLDKTYYQKKKLYDKDPSLFYLNQTYEKLIKDGSEEAIKLATEIKNKFLAVLSAPEIGDKNLMSPSQSKLLFALQGYDFGAQNFYNQGLLFGAGKAMLGASDIPIEAIKDSRYYYDRDTESIQQEKNYQQIKEESLKVAQQNLTDVGLSTGFMSEQDQIAKMYFNKITDYLQSGNFIKDIQSIAETDGTRGVKQYINALISGLMETVNITGEAKDLKKDFGSKIPETGKKKAIPISSNSASYDWSTDGNRSGLAFAGQDLASYTLNTDPQFAENLTGIERFNQIISLINQALKKLADSPNIGDQEIATKGAETLNKLSNSINGTIDPEEVKKSINELSNILSYAKVSIDSWTKYSEDTGKPLQDLAKENIHNMTEEEQLRLNTSYGARKQFDEIFSGTNQFFKEQSTRLMDVPSFENFDIMNQSDQDFYQKIKQYYYYREQYAKELYNNQEELQAIFKKFGTSDISEILNSNISTQETLSPKEYNLLEFLEGKKEFIDAFDKTIDSLQSDINSIDTMGDKKFENALENIQATFGDTEAFLDYIQKLYLETYGQGVNSINLGYSNNSQQTKTLQQVKYWGTLDQDWKSRPPKERFLGNTSKLDAFMPYGATDLDTAYENASNRLAKLKLDEQEAERTAVALKKQLIETKQEIKDAQNIITQTQKKYPTVTTSQGTKVSWKQAQQPEFGEYSLEEITADRRQYEDAKKKLRVKEKSLEEIREDRKSSKSVDYSKEIARIEKDIEYFEELINQEKELEELAKKSTSETETQKTIEETKRENQTIQKDTSNTFETIGDKSDKTTEQIQENNQEITQTVKSENDKIEKDTEATYENLENKPFELSEKTKQTVSTIKPNREDENHSYLNDYFSSDGKEDLPFIWEEYTQEEKDRITKDLAEAYLREQAEKNEKNQWKSEDRQYQASKNTERFGKGSILESQDADSVIAKIKQQDQSDQEINNIKEAIKAYSKFSQDQVTQLGKIAQLQAKIETLQELSNDASRKGAEISDEEAANIQKQLDALNQKLKAEEKGYQAATEAKKNTGIREGINTGKLNDFYVSQIKEIDKIYEAKAKEAIIVNSSRGQAAQGIKNDSEQTKLVNSYLKDYKELLKVQRDIARVQKQMENQSGKELRDSTDLVKQLELRKASIKENSAVYDKELNTLNGIELSETNRVKLSNEINRLDSQHEAQLIRINAQETRQASLVQEIAEGFRASFRNLTDYTMAYAVIGYIKQGINAVVQSTKELDSALVDLQIAAGSTRQETVAMLRDFNSLAKELGKSTSDVAAAANDWLRAGYAGEDAATLTKASMELSTLGMMEASEATTALISSLKGWQLEASEVISVVDKLTVIICGVCLVISIGHKLNCR